MQAEGAVLPFDLDLGVLDRVQQGTPGVVIGDRLVELPDLQPFLALQLSLEAWEEELRVASLALQLLDVPARCTVTSRHVSSPHFTYLIR